MARLAGQIAVRLSQSRAVGEIIAGLILGPSLFGLFLPATFTYVFPSAPAEPMTILSQIGLILLMFQIGLEFDFGHQPQSFMCSGRRCWCAVRCS